MATQIISTTQAATKYLARPYAPGWFDRLLVWLDRIGGWAWVLILGLTLFQFFYAHAILWLNGIIPAGAFDLRRSFFVLLVPYVIADWLYLRHFAQETFARFRPVLDMDDAHATRLEYELITVPARETWIATGIGVLLFVAYYILISPELIRDYSPNLQTNLLQFGWLSLPIFVFGMVGLGRGLYQLRMVNRIHRLAAQINLFHTPPLYAFASLTSRIALSYALFVYYMFLTRSDMLLGNPAVFAFMLVSVPVALGCFLLPLREMHLRLVQEKNRMLAQVNERFALLTARVHQAIDADEMQPMENWNKALANLALERDALEKIPTWPWQRGTLTGFLTALILPIVLWLVTRMLERFV